MRSDDNSYTPEQIEILQQAFDLLIESTGASSATDREELARSLIFEARNGVSSLEEILGRIGRSGKPL
jgi:hypothetical protein